MIPKPYRRRHACLVLFRFIASAKCLVPCALLCCSAALASGYWLVDGQPVQAPASDPSALYTDGTRNMQAPLKFDASVSSPNNGLFQGWFAPEGAYVDLLVLDEDEEVLWISSSPNVAFRVGDMFVSSSSMFNVAIGTSIGFEDHLLSGGWKIDSVLNDSLAILNRTYADTRYIQRSEGITVNHTIQAGDVLQIQNGIITAINP